eukprot:Skav231095  [mRNA]  locus=scaffold2525:109735:114528:- [translate_table: standard]
MNPTGLKGKGDMFQQLPLGTYSIQETHLSGRGIPLFRKELRWKQSPYHITHGPPAPLQSESIRAVGGKQTGVAVVSAYPTRVLGHDWDPQEYATARCLVTATQIQSHWVTIGTVYGYSDGHNRVDTQAHTNALLHRMGTRVVDGARGLRFLVGDWNQERPTIPQVDHWEAQGWEEAQHFAHRNWGYPVQATCKHATVKDHLYMSPEVLPYVKDVIVDWSYCPDHAVIQVILHDLAEPQALPYWKKVTPMQWPAHPPELTYESPSKHGNNTEQYRQIMEAFEQSIESAVGQTLPKQTFVAKGRAATMDVHWSTSQPAPVKPSRPGDIPTSMPVVTLQHSRWTRQIRRLQHYVRFAYHRDCTQPTHVEHAASLWRSIRLATGFGSSFSTWWSKQHHQLADTPGMLPDAPPTAQVAQAIFNEFLRRYQALEKELRDQRISQAKQRRSKDPVLIYKDLRKEQPEAVHSLIVRQQLAIRSKQVGPEVTLVELTTPLPPTADQILVNGIPVTFVAQANNKVSIPSPVAANVESHLLIETLVGDTLLVLEQFQSEWASRWQKHDHVAHDRWDAIAAFTQAALPSKPCQLPPITVAQWRHAVRSKKRTAATGPDSVTRSDMLAFPDQMVVDLLSILRSVEQGQPWPQQMVVGVVKALAKHPEAKMVQEYRPITIFALAYRVWGSLRSKPLLRHLKEIAPTTLLGNIPGRSPKHLWYHVQELVEQSHHENSLLAGGVLDIEKCFNAIPRQPVLTIATHVGLPAEVIVPWGSALRQMERRFEVNGCYGPPIPSSTGLPEGDSLSVVGMVLINLAVEAWVYHRFPSCTTWSFVDNIETITATAQQAVDSIQHLTDICTMLDLRVDPKKTFCWSNSAVGRKHLRDVACPQRLAVRDLGGHMNYSRQKTNFSIQDKIALLQPLWGRLARSVYAPAAKVRILATMAWPNLFYGVATNTLGSVHFDKLRTAAMRALGYTQKGANPSIQLSCIHQPTSDPEYYCVWQTILSFREFHTPEIGEYVLQQILQGRAASAGPCHSFLQVLHKLGWAWEGQGFCRDQVGHVFHMHSCSIAELQVRTRQAWQTRVFTDIAGHRPTMAGIADADVSVTMSSVAKFTPEEQALLRCALNGTQFTNNVLAHANLVESRQCSFCTAEDSQFHRHWECPFFADIRATYPWLCQQQPHLPQCTLCHGWVTGNEVHYALQHECSTIPDTSNDFELPEDMPAATLDLFLDGGCIHPSEPALRIGTWAVVLALPNKFVPVSTGGVPGLRQTPLRGEIWAAVSSLKLLSHLGSMTRLWIDNKTVWAVLTAWMEVPIYHCHKRKDADLWWLLWQQLERSKQWIEAILKVAAHCEVSQQMSPVDEWAVLGNAAADQAATRARESLPASLWRAWIRVSNHLQHSRRVATELHAMLAAIAQKALQANTVRQDVRPEGFSDQVLQPLSVDASLQQLVQMTAEDIPRTYQCDELAPFLHWLGSVLQGEEQTRWVAFHQLLLRYQKETNRFGPMPQAKRQGVAWRAGTGGDQYSHRQAVQGLQNFLTGICKAIERPLTIEQRRPASHVLAFWSGCIKVPCSDALLDELDTHFRGHTHVMPVRLVRDLEQVPSLCHD